MVFDRVKISRRLAFYCDPIAYCLLGLSLHLQMCINTLLDLKKDKGDSKTAAIATITINILGVIPQVGLREGRMYADLTPTFVGQRGCFQQTLSSRKAFSKTDLKKYQSKTNYGENIEENKSIDNKSKGNNNSDKIYEQDNGEIISVCPKYISCSLYMLAYQIPFYDIHM